MNLDGHDNSIIRSYIFSFMLTISYFFLGFGALFVGNEGMFYIFTVAVSLSGWLPGSLRHKNIDRIPYVLALPFLLLLLLLVQGIIESKSLPSLRALSVLMSVVAAGYFHVVFYMLACKGQNEYEGKGGERDPGGTP